MIQIRCTCIACGYSLVALQRNSGVSMCVIASSFLLHLHMVKFMNFGNNYSSQGPF